MFASSMTSEVDIIIEGPTTVTVEFRVLTLEFSILIKKIKLTFQLDEEFEFITVDGRTVMVHFLYSFYQTGYNNKHFIMF